MESIGLTRKEFEALPVKPTNTIIGEQWKIKSNDRWFLCEYTPYNSENILVKIKSIIIIEQIK
jgi:hypothetical protein